MITLFFKTGKKIMQVCALTILSLTLSTSCNKEDFDIVNLNNNQIKALGHAGMGAGRAYPSNTYESFLNCLATGADGFELDVQMTKDCVLVAFHDKELDDATNMKGMINSYTWAELSDSWYDKFPYKRYPLVQLDNFFLKLEDRNNYFFTIDCKLYTKESLDVFIEKYADVLVAFIEKYNLQANCTIESDDPVLLDRIQDLQPLYKVFYYSGSFEEGLETVMQHDLTGIAMDRAKISTAQIKTAHDLGIYVTIWNAYTKKDNTDAIRKNPDFIHSDNIEQLVKLLE